MQNVRFKPNLNESHIYQSDFGLCALLQPQAAQTHVRRVESNEPENRVETNRLKHHYETQLALDRQKGIAKDKRELILKGEYSKIGSTITYLQLLLRNLPKREFGMSVEQETAREGKTSKSMVPELHNSYMLKQSPNVFSFKPHISITQILSKLKGHKVWETRKSCGNTRFVITLPLVNGRLDSRNSRSPEQRLPNIALYFRVGYTTYK